MKGGVTPDRRCQGALKPNPVHAAGLAGLFLFNDGGGTRLRDLAGLIGDGTLGSGTQWVRGPHGWALRHNRTSASMVQFPGSVKAGPFTALWRGCFRAGPGSHYWAGEWAQSYVGGNNASWGFNVGTGGVVAFRAASRQLVSAIPVPLGEPFTAIGSYDGARVDLFVLANGVFAHETNTATGFVTNSAYTLRLGGYWGGNTSSGTQDLDTDLFVLWRRKLGFHEALALLRAPEQVVALPRRMVAVASAGGPAPAPPITPGSCVHAHGAASAAAVQIHALAAAHGHHAHDGGAATLAQIHGADAQGALHAHSAEPAAVTPGRMLTPQDGAQAHGTASPAIFQIHGAAPFGLRHLHGATAPLLTGGGDGPAPLWRRVAGERRVLRVALDRRIFQGSKRHGQESA